MKKILITIVFLACFAGLFLFNSESTTEHLRKTNRHNVWGPTCRNSCALQNGEICGWVSQGCCAKSYCVKNWKGQECPQGRLVTVIGCTTS